MTVVSYLLSYFLHWHHHAIFAIGSLLVIRPRSSSTVRSVIVCWYQPKNCSRSKSRSRRCQLWNVWFPASLLASLDQSRTLLIPSCGHNEVRGTCHHGSSSWNIPLTAKLVALKISKVTLSCICPIIWNARLGSRTSGSGQFHSDGMFFNLLSDCWDLPEDKHAGINFF